jgi:hypothetical protein
MRTRLAVRGLLAAMACVAWAGGIARGDGAQDRRPATPWRGVHMMASGHDGVPLLKRAIAEGLAPLGINALVLEVNYNYRFASHAELAAERGLTREDAGDLADVCRAHGIRLIPQFNCLGHQSWARNTFALLKKHPEFDETPDVPADNKGIYCRSWCPLHPGVNPVVFSLMDELIDAFGADAFHVGMDEIFLVASDKCPRCKGKDPADLIARAVSDYHDHLVGAKKLTMLMWGDRLLDASSTGYGKWEASANGTSPAIDRIPKDIVICDWHYEPRETYPSVHLFQEKGFRVWPSSWRNERAALALRDDARRGVTGRMVGHLCTTWVNSDAVCRALLNDGGTTDTRAIEVVATMRACMNASDRRAGGAEIPAARPRQR